MARRDGYSRGLESLEDIRASDRFIEQLRVSGTYEPSSRTDATLAAALLTWRDEARDEPLTPPPSVEEIGSVRPFVQPRRIVRRSIAVAGVLLAMSSAVATAVDGDPLRPVQFLVDFGVDVGERIVAPDTESSSGEETGETILPNEQVDSSPVDGLGSTPPWVAADEDPQDDITAPDPDAPVIAPDEGTNPPIEEGPPVIEPTDPAPADEGETEVPPDDGGETTPPPDDGGETTPPPDDGGETTPPPDDGGETTPPPDDGGETTPPPDDGGETPYGGDDGIDGEDDTDDQGEDQNTGGDPASDDDSGNGDDAGDDLSAPDHGQSGEPSNDGQLPEPPQSTGGEDDSDEWDDEFEEGDLDPGHFEDWSVHEFFPGWWLSLR